MLGQGVKSLVKGVWWMFLLRGIVAILFGLLTFFAPGLAVASLVMYFGVFAFLDGATTTLGAIKSRKVDGSWWLFALEGVLGLIIGAMALTAPGAVALSFLVWFAVWLMFSGILRILTAIRLRKEIKGEWMMIAGGAIAFLFGVSLISQPVAGILGMTWLIGGFALLIGIVMVLLAMKARGFAQHVGEAVLA